jgi:heavy metal translocating P-type ATPase
MNLKLIARQNFLELTRIAVVGIVSMMFHYMLLPLPVLLVALLFGLSGLAKDAVEDLFKKHKIGTELYITIAVIVAVAGKEYLAAGVVLMIILIAELIGDIMNERARSSIKSLVDALPKTARVRRADTREEIVLIENLQVGDVVLVNAGEKIPIDGIVIDGSATVNQAAITGENMPLEKSVNDEVFGGTILQNGTLDIRVTKLWADTLFARIINLVEEAQENQAPVEKLTDRIATWLVPVSFIFVAAVYLFTRDVRMIIALLIFTSPAELGLATPLVTVAGIARAAREGILLKGGIFLEALAHVDTFVFDKTGTLTAGKPQVTGLELVTDKYSSAQVLALAAGADRRSNHPLAIAIVQYAQAQNSSVLEPSSFTITKGRGVYAEVDGFRVELGNDALLKDKNISLPQLHAPITDGTAVFVVINDELVAVLQLADTLRDSARETIAALRRDGVRNIVLLTGDNAATAKSIAEAVGITDYQAGLLPEDKIRIVKELQGAKGARVAMIGDGINDAPALAQAEVGIAMGIMGNEAAMDAADIVLMGEDLGKIVTVRLLSRRAYRTIKENIFVGVGVVHVAGIALVLLNIIGPIQAAAIHLVPDTLVFLNSIKLLKVKLG